MIPFVSGTVASMGVDAAGAAGAGVTSRARFLRRCAELGPGHASGGGLRRIRAPFMMERMKNFAPLTLRNVALGCAFGITFLFVVATVALLTALFYDLSFVLEKKDAVGAWATLIGNMIGAVFSGLLAIGAAFGAVYLERMQKQAEESGRLKRIAAPGRQWIMHTAFNIGSFVGAIERWMHPTDTKSEFPLFLGKTAEPIYMAEIDAPLRARIESEFPETIRWFGEADRIRENIRLVTLAALQRANDLMVEQADKRVAAEPLIEILAQLQNFCAVLNEVYSAIVSENGIEIARTNYNRAKDLIGLISNGMRDVRSERRKAMSEERLARAERMRSSFRPTIEGE